jgi:hypothetical protein
MAVENYEGRPVAAKKPLRINSVKRRAKHLRKILGNI